MDDFLERRALTIAAAAGLIIPLSGLTALSFPFGPKTWRVAVYVAGLAFLAAALALAVLALLPPELRRERLPAKSVLVFSAAASLAAGVLLIATNIAATTVESLTNDLTFGG